MTKFFTYLLAGLLLFPAVNLFAQSLEELVDEEMKKDLDLREKARLHQRKLLERVEQMQKFVDENRQSRRESEERADFLGKLAAQEDLGKDAYQPLVNDAGRMTSTPFVGHTAPSSLGLYDKSHDFSAMQQLLRRDFKIQGQIGKKGEKDKLTFSSLIYQIEAGLAKGYSEKEVVTGVVKAITAGLTLRSYLEGKAELDLPSLRKVLRFHFAEKGPTDLYKDLVNLTQSPSESALDFLVRALDLRQKITFASKEADSGLQYDNSLVKKMFLHTVYTGLVSENIKVEVRSLLENTGVSDEALMEGFAKACANEVERQNKLEITCNEEQTSNVVKKKKGDANAKNESSVQGQIAALVAEVRELKSQISQSKGGTAVPSVQEESGNVEKKKKRNRHCSACKDNPKDCRHCWHCGSGEHFYAGCKARVSDQGKAKGPLPGDRK